MEVKLYNNSGWYNKGRLIGLYICMYVARLVGR